MEWVNPARHWETEVLSGRRTRDLWSGIRNRFGHDVAPEETMRRLKAWADEHGVALRWERTTNSSGYADYWVHFSPPRHR